MKVNNKVMDLDIHTQIKYGWHRAEGEEGDFIQFEFSGEKKAERVQCVNMFSEQ